jgi:O-antigen ligase
MRQLSFVLLWILIMIIPWEGLFAIPGLTTSAKILGVLTFFTGLAGALLSGRVRFPRALICLVLFIGWCALSAQWAPHPEAALDRAETYALLSTLVWLICQLADNPKRLKSLIRAFVLGIAMIVANMYFGYLHAGLPVNSPDYVRYTADTTDANGFALFCGLGILFAFYLIRQREKTGFELPNIFYWGFIIAAGLAIPLSGSRTGVVSGAVVGFVLLGALRNVTWKARLGLVVSGLLVALLISQLVGRGTFARFAEGTSSRSFGERYDAWVSGLAAWSETPILGVGAASYGDITASRGPRRMPAHNTFIGVLVESGLIGFTLYFLFWAIVIRRIMLLPKVDRYFWLGVFATFLPLNIAGSMEYNKITWLIGALALSQAPQPSAAGAKKRGTAPPIFRGPALSPPPSQHKESA